MLTLDRLDSIAVVSTGGNELAIDGSGYITANINGSVTVSATDLDIRDLVYTSDSVTAHQGGTWTIDSITNSVTVDAIDLDVRDLVYTSDSVTSYQGGTWTMGITEDPYDTHKATNATVTTTAAEIVATPLTDRKRIVIQNLGTADIYLGESSGVTSSTGLLISKKSNYELKASANMDLYLIAASGSQDVRIHELGA